MSISFGEWSKIHALLVKICQRNVKFKESHTWYYGCHESDSSLKYKYICLICEEKIKDGLIDKHGIAHLKELNLLPFI